jgi:hypothetical protein
MLERYKNVDLSARIKTLTKKLTKDNGNRILGDSRFWAPIRDETGKGRGIIRFLPENEESEKSLPVVEIYTHFISTAPVSGGVPRFIYDLCPTTIGLPCPICEANRELHLSGDKANIELAKTRNKSTSFVSNILVIKDEKKPENNGKVFLFAFKFKIKTLLDNALNPEFTTDTPFDPFAPYNSYNLDYRILGQKLKTTYSTSVWEKNRSSLSDDDDEVERILSERYDLASLFEPDLFRPYEDLKERFNSIITMDTKNTTVTNVSKPKVAATAKVNSSGEELKEGKDEFDEYVELLRQDDEDLPF